MRGAAAVAGKSAGWPRQIELIAALDLSRMSVLLTSFLAYL